jgi:hypothetical protein
MFDLGRRLRLVLIGAICFGAAACAATTPEAPPQEVATRAPASRSEAVEEEHLEATESALATATGGPLPELQPLVSLASCATSTRVAPFFDRTSDPNGILATNGTLRTRAVVQNAGSARNEARVVDSISVTPAESQVTVSGVFDVAGTIRGMGGLGWAKAAVYMFIHVRPSADAAPVCSTQVDIGRETMGPNPERPLTGAQRASCTFHRDAGDPTEYRVEIGLGAWADVLGIGAWATPVVRGTLRGITTRNCVQPAVITGQGGLCLDLPTGGGSARVSSCTHEAQHVFWRLETGQLWRPAGCLEAGGGGESPFIAACDESNRAQRWDIGPSDLLSSRGVCLEIRPGSTAVRMATCSSTLNPNQRWFVQ